MICRRSCRKNVPILFFSSLSAEVLFLDDEHNCTPTDLASFQQQSVACEEMMEGHAQVAL